MRVNWMRCGIDLIPLALLLTASFSIEFAGAAVTAQSEVEIPVGSGIVAPYEIASDPTDDQHILVVTGSGEYGGESYLYRLDRDSLLPINLPLRVGFNSSDMLVDGSYVWIVSRSSNTVYLVDLVSFTVISEIEVGVQPITIAAAFPKAFVGHYGDGSIHELEFGAAGLETKKIVQTNSVVYDLTLGGNNYLYAVMPLLGSVYEFDGNLDQTRSFNVGNNLSFDSEYLSNKLFVADRDGYLIVIELSSGVAESVDLAERLGIERSSLAERGIDPTDIDIMGNKLFITNNRQSSVILDLALSELPLVATYPAGIRTFVDDQEDIYITRALSNTIIKCAEISSVYECDSKRGIAIIDIETKSNTLAYVLSNYDLRMLEADSFNPITVANENDWTWYLIEPDYESQGYIAAAIKNSDSEVYLLRLSSDGTISEIANIPYVPYAISTVSNEILIVDRLGARVSLIRGEDLVYSLNVTTRPRDAVRMSNGDWMIIHDTAPDIGFTRISSSGETQYTNRNINNDYFYKVARVPNKDLFVVTTARGNLGVFNSNMEMVYGQSLPLLFPSDMGVVQDTIYLTSLTSDFIFAIDTRNWTSKKLFGAGSLSRFISGAAGVFAVDGNGQQIRKYSGVDSFTSEPYDDIVVIDVVSNTVTLNYIGEGQADSLWLYVGDEVEDGSYFNSGRQNGGSFTFTLPADYDEQNQFITAYALVNGAWYMQSLRPTIIPRIVSPAMGTKFSGTTQTFVWETGGANVNDLWLYVGNKAGSNNYHDSGRLASSALSAVVGGLPDDGTPVYVKLWYRVAGDNTWYFVEEIYTAIGNTPEITLPTSGTQLSGTSQTFEWNNNGASVSHYWLDIGSSVGGTNYYRSGNVNAAQSVTVNGLPGDGSSTVYARLWYRIDSGSWQYVDTTYIASAISNPVPSIVSPVASSQLTNTSGTETITWEENGYNGAEYWLYAGSTQGGRNYYDSGLLGAVLSDSVSNLPTNGTPVWVRLWYRSSTSASWSFTDAQYTAVGNSPVVSSSSGTNTLTSPTDTFTWTDPNGTVSAWWLYVGSSAGGLEYENSGNIGSQLTYTTQANNLPTGSVSVYVRLWYQEGAGTAWQYVDKVFSSAP